MFPPVYPNCSGSIEKRGAVYTKRWVVQLILDLAGYTADVNLVDKLAVEPAAGAGAFLVEMSRRLIQSCRRQGRPFSDCALSLLAFELDENSAHAARLAVSEGLRKDGTPASLADELAAGWIRTGDYLFEAFQLPHADFVIGNPPYIRLEDISPDVAGLYRSAYPSMMGRADLYVAFYEAGLRQLRPGGVCAYICADRWMFNQYGAELRNLVTSAYSVETIVEMHEANAFFDDVSAYPAVTVLRNAPQRKVVVAAAKSHVESVAPSVLAKAILDGTPEAAKAVPGLTIVSVNSWFSKSDPWPCSSPGKIQLLRRLEERFRPLEPNCKTTRVGIGVATGMDDVFITLREDLVESSRLLPLAMARDTMTGHLAWSGHYLVDPWGEDGLVDLADYPRLRAYLESHQALLSRRHTAQRNTRGWYRTIDRVSHSLMGRPKLYIPDIKNELNPVLDSGSTYPHHNLYYIQSDEWDLEVLGGLLLSAVAHLFIESYGVRMRGGYLRFQAQYLRRIRVPSPQSVTRKQSAGLREAFKRRDREAATAIGLSIYGIERSELEGSLEP